MVPFTRIKADIDWLLKRDTRIIAASGIQSGEWAAHVFEGLCQGFNGARNRGRLPFVEYEFEAASHDNVTTEGVHTAGTLRMRVRALQTASLEANAVIDALTQTCLLAIRTWWFNNTPTRSQTQVANTSQLYSESTGSSGAVTNDKMSAVQESTLVINYWSDKADMGGV